MTSGGAAPSGTAETIELQISGMTCAGCVRSIERAVAAVPGVARAEVNLATGTASVEYEAPLADVSDIREAVERAGYGARETQPAITEAKGEEQQREAAIWKRKFILAAVFTLPLLVVAMSHGALVFPGGHWMQLALTLPVVLYSGRQFFVSAWKGLRRRSADMNTLIAVGTGSAFLYSLVATIDRSLSERGQWQRTRILVETRSFRHRKCGLCYRVPQHPGRRCAASREIESVHP